jgi:hypothetical protein
MQLEHHPDRIETGNALGHEPQNTSALASDTPGPEYLKLEKKTHYQLIYCDYKVLGNSKA